MPDAAATFEEHLAREIIHSERARMAILAGLIGLLIVFFGLVFELYRDEYRQIFSRPRVMFHAGAMFAVLLCYELVVRHVIGRRLEQGKVVPNALSTRWRSCSVR